MNAEAKTAEVKPMEREQDHSPYSALGCVVMLLAAGTLVKLAAATPIFHLFH